MNESERLSPKAIRYLNKQLAPQGLRVCIHCQGHAQRLDGEHFYPSRTCLGGYETVCKACRNRSMAARAKERYDTDEAYRLRKNAITSDWKRRHPDYTREWGRQKAAVLARVLEKRVRS